MIGFYICDTGCGAYRAIEGEWHPVGAGEWDHVTGRDPGPCPRCGETDLSVSVDGPVDGDEIDDA